MRRLAIIVYALLSVSCYLVYSLQVTPVYASEREWEDTLTFYPYTTVLKENMRNITATYTQRVTVTFKEATNISITKLYRLTANDTTFVEIIDGAVTQRGCTYSPLKNGETLIFNVYAQPVDDVDNNTRCSILMTVVQDPPARSQRVEIIITPELQLTLRTLPHVKLTWSHLITNNLPFEYAVTIWNKGTNPLNVTLHSWLTDVYNNDLHPLPTRTVYVEGHRNITVDYMMNMPIASSPFKAIESLQRTQILRVTATYEGITTDPLLATVDIDGTNIIPLIIGVVSVISIMGVAVIWYRKHTPRVEIPQEVIMVE